MSKRKKSKPFPSSVELANKQALRVDEFAYMNSISRSQAFTEIRHGRLKIFRVGKRYLITPEAIREWQARNTPKAA